MKCIFPGKSSQILISTVFVALITAGCVSSTETKQGADIVKPSWQLIWQDEFSDAQINKNDWSFTVDCAGGGNDELQCYTDRKENTFIENGFLHLVAKEESFSGPKYNEAHKKYARNDKSKVSPFTSAKIHTQNKMSFRYGRVDVRAKSPRGQGMWPAIWMLSNDSVYGAWPASGEIDIMEALNPGVSKNETHGTLHYGLPWPQWENKVQEYPMQESPADNFHVYSIEWEADEIRWYVDGEHFQTQTSEGWYNYIWQGQQQGFKVANARAPFDQAFYLILNIAIGGNWPGDPDRNWSADREMLIDYVRVYQCSKGDADAADYTGEGCATLDPAIKVNSDKSNGSPGINRYTLYADGPEALSFDVENTQLSHALVAGQSASKNGQVIQQDVNLNDEHGKVWDIKFNGLGNAFLQSPDMSARAGYENGVVLGGGPGWRHNGEIQFDIFVKSKSSDSQLIIKLASGPKNEGQVGIAMPVSGKWQHVAVKVADILNSKRLENGGVDLGGVKKLFVLQHSGASAHLLIDNLTLQCAYNVEPEDWQIGKTCGIYPQETPLAPVNFKINETQWSAWDCCDGATFNETIDQEAGRVVEYKFSAKAAAPGFKAPGTLDLSAYAGGSLEFDFKQLSAPPGDSVWHVKVEAETTAGQVLLTDGGPMPNGQWQHYSFPLTGEMDKIDMSNVKLIMVFPTWAKADDAVMRINNVRFVAP